MIDIITIAVETLRKLFDDMDVTSLVAYVICIVTLLDSRFDFFLFQRFNRNTVVSTMLVSLFQTSPLSKYVDDF